MMMKDDKKKMVSIIISKMGKKPEDMQEMPQEPGPEKDDSVGCEACAEEIISAIEQKNPKMLVEALKSFMEMSQEPEEEKE